jgi:hypothetical protein
LARADRRRQQQALDRERRHIDRAIARGEEGPPHWQDPVPTREQAAAIAAVNEERQQRAQAAAAGFEANTRQLIASIPPHLRDTPEARLMVSRVQASWSIPLPKPIAERMQREWLEFLQRQPENVAPRAAAAGMWLPGMPT